MDWIDKTILNFLQRRSKTDELNDLVEWADEKKNKDSLLNNLKIWLWAGQLDHKKPKVEFSHTWKIIQIKQSLGSGYKVSINSLLRYAAILFLLLNIGWWSAHLYYKGSISSQTQPFIVTANQSANSVITLPDETIVYLRSGSTLQYDSRFNQKHREVSLVGEAYFDVKSDKSKHFKVITEKAQIKVFGTKFNVFAPKKSTIYQTTLVEGSVSFMSHSGKEYQIQPNQMIEYDIKKNNVKIKKVDTELYTAWKDGKVIFRDETLGEITNKLERIYNVKFVYKNPKLIDKYSFSGTFYKETSIGEVITMLKISIPIKVERLERFPEPDIIYLE